MKGKDTVIIIAVAAVGAIFSFVVAQFIFGGEKAYKLQAPTVDAITSEFQQPNTKYFNSSSINPTKDIMIGDSTNNAPFKSN